MRKRDRSGFFEEKAFFKEKAICLTMKNRSE